MGKPRLNVTLLDHLTAISGQYVNVLSFLSTAQLADVVGNIGSIDVTAKFNQALATGLRVWAPEGTYLITGELLFAYPGQILQGSGRYVTTLKITGAFNLAARGVCVATCGEEGPQLRDFGIAFDQPDTAVRANLIAYPPAIYFRDTPRFTMQNVRIACAMTAVDMKGNSGGAFFDTVEISAFDKHFDIDGCLDTVRMTGVHLWVFGTTASQMTANQRSIYWDGATIGIEVGICDGLYLTGCLFICKGKQLWAKPGVAGYGPFILASNTDFDTYASIVFEKGQAMFSSCLFTQADANQQVVVQTGGWMKFTGCEFEAAVTLVNPMFALSGTSTIGTYPLMQVSNSQIRYSLDMTVFQVEQASGSGNLDLVGNSFYNDLNHPFVKPVIHAKAGARLTAIGNRITDKGTGSGTFIQVDVDDQHTVTGNNFCGWTMVLPADQVEGNYQSNTGLALDVINADGFLIGPPRVKRITGTLDGAGAATVPHGVANAQLCTLFFHAVSKDLAAGAAPLTVTSVDGTNVNVTGGIAGANFRVSLFYSSEQQAPW